MMAGRKTRLRQAYVAASSMALHKLYGRARQSEATAASALWFARFRFAPLGAGFEPSPR